MRQPFFVTGYQVTEDNMARIAQWCEGGIVTRDDISFVRVPVNRPASVKQTEGHVGTWVLLSFTDKGDKSFKVYTADRLEQTFIATSAGEMYEAAGRLFAGNEIEDDDDSEDDTKLTSTDRIGNNIRALPKQTDPRVMNFKPAR